MNIVKFDEQYGKVIAFPNVGQTPSGSVELNRNDGTEIGPIEREMRTVIGKLRDCRYPDTFNWSIYDDLARKFIEPPRGGVVFNTTFRLVNLHPTCSNCHYSFEIDTYGRGCFHDCTYCYSKEQLSKHGMWNRPQPFPVDLADIRKTFYTVFETDGNSKWRDVLEKKVPLRIGSMSDPFLWMDTKYGVTKEFLKILKFYRYPHIIFTRSDLVAHDDYLALMDKNLSVVQMSIIGNNHKVIRTIEPGAPSYKRRLIALKKLSSEGFRTAVRVNPLFPQRPDGFFTDYTSVLQRFGSEDLIPKLNFYNDDFIGELADSGVNTILAGFVRLSTVAVKHLSDTLGVDLRLFFNEDARKLSSDKRYSDREVAHYYRAFKERCVENKVRFSTCYIGNGEKDYFQYQEMWSNKSDCCDVIGQLPSFESSAQTISQETRYRLATHSLRKSVPMQPPQN